MPKVSKIYIRQNGVQKQVRPPLPYSPTANTKLYYPFINNQTDVTGNTSIPITGTQQTIWCSFSISSGAVAITNGYGLWIRFFSYWLKCDTLSSSQYTMALNTEYAFMNFMPSDSNSSHARNVIYVMWTTTSPYNWTWYYSWSKTITLNQRNHLAYWIDANGNYIWVLNGTSVWSWTRSWTQFHNSSWWPNLMWANASCTMTFSDVIWEDRVRTLQEVQDYFNKTKSTYWIS